MRTLSRLSEDDTENDLNPGSSGVGRAVFCRLAKMWLKGAWPYIIKPI